MITLRQEGDAALAPGTALSLRLHAGACHLFDAGGEAFRRTVALPR
jgi:hypothetical protein